ncbi:MAG: hypothetical protein OEV31_03005 [Gammaproteobacteria bacterium]|nr:hypothetical protein [Gammaproteobacteria bacterium]
MKNKRYMNDNTGSAPARRTASPTQRLLDGLYRQRGELGDVANDLIARFRAAGIRIARRSSARTKKT